MMESGISLTQTCMFTKVAQSPVPLSTAGIKQRQVPLLTVWSLFPASSLLRKLSPSFPARVHPKCSPYCFWYFCLLFLLVFMLVFFPPAPHSPAVSMTFFPASS